MIKEIQKIKNIYTVTWIKSVDDRKLLIFNKIFLVLTEYSNIIGFIIYVQTYVFFK